LRPTSAESHTVESDTIPLLVSCQNDKSISELVRSDLEEVYNVGGGYLQCRLTASNVKRLGALPSVKYADILERNDLVMNNSAFEASGFVCGSDGQPIDLDLTGRNVLIGVIDTGIDLKHRCFYSQEGKLRIAGLLEQGHQKARVRTTPARSWSMNWRQAATLVETSMDMGRTFPASPPARAHIFAESPHKPSS